MGSAVVWRFCDWPRNSVAVRLLLARNPILDRTDDGYRCPGGILAEMTMSNKRLSASSRAISTLTIALIVIIVVGAVATAAVLWWLAGSENLVTEEMNYSDFTEVEVGWAFDVDITRSTSYSVIITADEYVEVSLEGTQEYERKLTFDYIQVSKTGDQLRISLESGYTYRSSHMWRPLILRAEITMPDLYELMLSGAAHGSVEGFSFSHELNLTLSGASFLDIVDVSAGDAEIELSGASRLEGKGEANDLHIIASGASHLELEEFPAHNANVSLSGASRATVNLDGRLDGDLSGSSHLLYLGEPTVVDVNTSGGSTVGRK